MASQPRGLQNFISDIRNCQGKEEERARVDKELANIRQKFAASSSLNSYQKKKYVWKMCYIYMLGYDIDFGHIEIISLLSSSKFQEKSVGYMGVALLLKPGTISSRHLATLHLLIYRILSVFVVLLLL